MLSRCSGKGEVLGMLKVGRKHLFLFDEKETVREVEPLCVLDFFVLGEYQRHGVGKALFDYMLKVPSTYLPTYLLCITLLYYTIVHYTAGISLSSYRYL